MAKISVLEFEKALKSLSKAIALEKDDISRDAAIQRYKFCIELAWKCGRKIMGTKSSSPKNVIRELAQDSIIDNPTLWLKAIDYRNLSSHTYDEVLADEVYEFAKNFIPVLESFIKKL